MKKFISAMMIAILLAGSWDSRVFAEEVNQMKPEEAVEEVSDKPPEGNTKNVYDQQVEKILLGNDVEIEVEETARVHSEAGEEQSLEAVVEEIIDPEENTMFLAMNEGSTETEGNTEKVTLRVGEKVNYGNWSTNYFYINDQLAYCLEPEKETPSGGDYIAEVLDNAQLTKGMYYLMGGPGFTADIREAFFSSAAGFTDKQIYAFCHAILSFIYSGYDIDSDAFLGLNEDEKDGIMTISYQIRDRLPAPPDGRISISPNHQTAYWDKKSGNQKTDVYQIAGDARNVLKFTLPDRVKLHNLVTGSSGSGTVSVKGGDSFWLEADAGMNGRWESGKLKGSIQDTYMSFLIQSPGDGQDIGGLSYHKEPLITAEFSVEWMGRGIIRIKKVCTQTGEVLARAEFDVCARDNIVRNGVTIAKAGEIMAEIVTDSKGFSDTPLLPVNEHYIIRETKAPEGYAISDKAAAGIEVYLASDAGSSGNNIPTVQIEVDNTVIDCDFTVHKVIKASDIVWENGNPTFFFQITGKDMKGRPHTYACMMEFTRKYVESHTDKNGNVKKSTVFENIPCGQKYSVTEQNINRYVLNEVKSPDSNIKIDRLQESKYGVLSEKMFGITVDLYEKPYGSSVTFVNKKIRWDDWSHNQTAENCVE